MKVFNEVEKVIAELPPRKAIVLSFWLKEFKAARRHKQIKRFAAAFKALADHRKSNGDTSFN